MPGMFRCLLNCDKAAQDERTGRSVLPHDPFRLGATRPAADRGRDKGLNLAPPSEPDGRISRLRLSSRWVLCREGAALRLVPQCGGLTFGVLQANGTWRTPPLAIHMRINKATLVSRKPCRERIFVLSAVF